MNVLITGSRGFIGKNLKIFLLDKKLNIFEFNRGDNLKKLEKLIKLSDIIFQGFNDRILWISENYEDGLPRANYLGSGKDKSLHASRYLQFS